MPALDLILASGSPYRAHSLSRLGLPFTQFAAGSDETPLCGETPGALAERLAHAKTRAVANMHPAALVIGSDQVAELDGQALGKPGSMSAAREQLARCSGRTLTFYTALCVLEPGSLEHAIVDLTQVRFRKLSTDEIRRYVDAEHVLDCAGSFKCEGLGISLFEGIESSDPTALLGLPLIALSRILRTCGVMLP